MNRFFNALLLFLLFPTMALTVFVGFDLPVDFLKVSGSNIPYRNEVFLVLGLFLLLINLRRSIRRWMGMNLVNKTSRFSWNEEVSKERRLRVYVYNGLEALVMTAVGTALFTVSPEAWFPATALWFGAFDNVIFTLVGLSGGKYRAGITSKAVILADRDVQLVYFSGLRKVTIHQDSIYFDYIKGLQLSIPLDSIEQGQRDTFFETLEKQIDRDKVFITKNR
jgi:hypothetical protein